MPINKEYAEVLVQTALELGAVNAVPFAIEDIVFDPRTILKCMFGCSDWGKGHTCPSRPGNLSLKQYEALLKKYSWGIIIHAHDKRTTQAVSYQLESKAFVEGFYLAFSMCDCALCKECAGFSGEPCRNVKKARPAFHSVGIDVFATARKFNLPIYTLKDETQEQNWYSAVFVE
jgi:predicted metal-binding protein